MWQIQWLLGLLPDWVWHLVLFLGIAAVLAGMFLKMVPFVSTYSLPIKAIGAVVTALALWMEGGIATEAKWLERVAELEEQVKVAEAKSAQVNTVIETVYVDKIQIVEKTKVITRNAIRNSANKIDRVCKIEPEVITILNDAAKITANTGVKK
jgi:hypothetical protein